MELKTKDLSTALKIAAITIEKRNTIPILSNAVIDYDGGEKAHIRATNLYQAITVAVPTINGQRIRAAFGAPDAIARLITAGGAETVVIEAGKGDDAHKHVVRAGELAGEITTLPADDLPHIDISSVPDFMAELGTDAIDMMLRVFGACSTEETRYYLNGIYFHHVEGWTYRAVCTDGHRLYFGTIELPGAVGPCITGQGSSKGVIIPRHAIHMLRQLRPHMAKDQPLRFTIAGGITPNKPADLAEKPAGTMSRIGFAMVAHGFDVSLTTKTIDGTFPDYTRVIPQQNDTDQQVVFRRADLRRALDGITAGMVERTRAVKLTFDPAGKLIVSAKWIDFGFEGKIAIEAKTKNKQPFEIGYNAAYLRGLINACGGEELVITVADSASPGSIVDPAATDFRAVLMPMRV